MFFIILKSYIVILFVDGRVIIILKSYIVILFVDGKVIIIFKKLYSYFIC